MRIIALMLVRNEEWVIGASLRAALQWCDGAAVYLDRSADATRRIVEEVFAEFSGVRNWVVARNEPSTAGLWPEMEMRQRNLEDGRELGGTHFAIVDADEILTANLLPSIRGWVGSLEPRELLDLPMVPTWRGLDRYRADDSVWARGIITTAFKDHPDLHWAAPSEGGYQHHSRPPLGWGGPRLAPLAHGEGGVMHLQFADWRRLVAKHVLYRMRDTVSWPGKEHPEHLNWLYDQALSEAKLRTDPIPATWWAPGIKEEVRLGLTPWHETAIRELLREHGLGPFSGLDLKGYEKEAACK